METNMISVNSDGRLSVGWVQNGIKNKRVFRSEKEADRYQELVEDIQRAMRLAEEMERFNRNFKYDPEIVELKNAELGKEIEELKERIRVKRTLKKKLGEANQKLSEQPRNVIDRASFFKELKELKAEIIRLDRFFREHAIVSLHRQLQEALSEMKSYFQYQKESIKSVEKSFADINKEVVSNLGSIKVRERVLSLREVVSYLGVSRSSVESMMFLEGLPYFRVGNRYRIKEKDLTKWIEKRKKAK